MNLRFTACLSTASGLYYILRQEEGAEDQIVANGMNKNFAEAITCVLNSHNALSTMHQTYELLSSIGPLLTHVESLCQAKNSDARNRAYTELMKAYKELP